MRSLLCRIPHVYRTPAAARRLDPAQENAHQLVKTFGRLRRSR
jgi:hypothetical protein